MFVMQHSIVCRVCLVTAKVRGKKDRRLVRVRWRHWRPEGDETGLGWRGPIPRGRRGSYRIVHRQSSPFHLRTPARVTQEQLQRHHGDSVSLRVCFSLDEAIVYTVPELSTYSPNPTQRQNRVVWPG